jgi:hypothetical protein
LDARWENAKIKEKIFWTHFLECVPFFPWLDENEKFARRSYKAIGTWLAFAHHVFINKY